MLRGRLLGAFPEKLVGSPASRERSVPFADSAAGFKRYHECVVRCELGVRLPNAVCARLVTPARVRTVSGNI